MKMTFSKIMIAALVIFVLISGSFISFLVVTNANSLILLISILFIVLIAALFLGYTLAIRKQMTMVLNKLSETIQSFMNMQDHQVFSMLEDTMLSKIQTQIIKLSRMLQAQNQRHLEDSESVKSLISDISHQLKTPLTNLNMYYNMLIDSNLSADKRSEFTQIVQNELIHLNWLMESLIKMSRLESGIIKLNIENQPIDKTVLTAIKQIFPKANDKQIELRFHSDQAIITEHDVRWTGEAIVNLLDNAVKYTQAHGTIDITIQKYEMFARIDVKDNGAGITEQEINSIFQRFYRSENAKQTEGVGIGLYLVRKIVAQQGGYIKVSSMIGQGSSFSIFMPIN
ncbi:sensor histidine kinase [Paenibacillus faecalis]|uniref:sensor histidine kinase n=1 Tax=Paenibacillus faecalis TaxID=2079532 RepID=UPI000D10B7B3|nr:HAMP domain-containing sensor histidine kinase [Paenibacillus faecalis]